MNIKTRYVKDIALLNRRATISFSKNGYAQWSNLRIWNDFIMEARVIVKIWVPYKAQVIQKLDSHES